MTIKHKISSIKKLRKELRRLEGQIELEKVELLSSIDQYKNSLWPFRVMNRFKKTVESISENKLIVLGAQLAYSALQTAKNEKESKEEGEKKDMKASVVDFLKNTAKNFLENYVKQGDEK